MNELRQQLEILRARVAGIDAKYAVQNHALSTRR